MVSTNTNSTKTIFENFNVYQSFNKLTSILYQFLAGSISPTKNKVMGLFFEKTIIIIFANQTYDDNIY